MQIICGDGCTVRLEPTGVVTCITSSTDQGQGSDTGITQLVAQTLGLPIDHIRLVANDTAVTAVGGGTWASRNLSIGGEAARVAATMLRNRLIDIAAAHFSVHRNDVYLAESTLVERNSDRSISLAELATLMYYHPEQLSQAADLSPHATYYFQPARPYLVPNGAQASLIELDTDSGFVKPLKHWVVEDCGLVVNPLLADEQIRGGVVQGLGAALFEECRYDERGQLQTATLADYLVPMPADMPDIFVDHVANVDDSAAPAIKGVGEAGAIASCAAFLNAVNDALRPSGAIITEVPCTPERVLRALGRIG